MRANTNIETKQRRQLRLSDFRGVDYFSSPLDVQENRATDMVNFIHDNGKNKKRNGWEQIIKTIPGRINMIYPYQYNGSEELLVYAGTKFYRITKAPQRSESDYIVEPLKTWDVVIYTDQRCLAFEQNGSIYVIGCGSYLRYRRNDPSAAYDLNMVEAYIPTTTIDINAEGSEVVRATLENANLLTNERKNKLVGAGSGSVWKLDSEVNIGTIVTVDYVKETLLDDHNAKSETLQFTNRGQGPTLYDKSGNEVGSITYLGALTLNRDTTPMEAGTRNNITVTFKANTDIERKRSMILNCQFGVLFGVGGAADRLFLSGNPDYKNVVFFSEADNFAYFPDQYTATFGTDRQPIKSFLRLNDKTLAVFKEYSAGEPSVYYQTGEYRTEYDDEGNVERITPVFSITAGATTESAVNHWCTETLAGENLILSKNGVYSIKLRENVQTDEYIATLRSLSIAPKLAEHNSLAEASCVSHRGKYYLSVDGVCYVADSLYKYNSKNSSGTQYEWWYWENVPARVWAEIDGMLCFGTDDGRICAFKSEYSDKCFDLGESGEFAVNHERDCITYNKRFKPMVNERVMIRTDSVFAVVLNNGDFDIIAGSDGDISITKNSKVQFEDLYKFEGLPLRYFNPNESHLYNNIYKITAFDTKYKTITIKDENGEGFHTYDYGEGKFLLDVSWMDLYVANLVEYTDENGNTSKGFQIKLKKDETTPLDFADVATMENEDGENITIGASNIIVHLSHETPVSARWVTPIFDLGTNESSKTLYKLTISVDPKSYGTLRFGYQTRFSANELAIKTAKPFSFEEMDFENFTFETGFWSSYSVKVKVPKFNYIRFWFESNTSEYCSINDFSAIYAINSRNLGVR